MDQPRRAAIDYIKRKTAREKLSALKSSSLTAKVDSKDPADLSSTKPLKKRAIKFTAAVASTSTSAMANRKRKMDSGEIIAILDSFISQDSVVDRQQTIFRCVENILQAVQKDNNAFDDEKIKAKMEACAKLLLKVINTTSNPELAAITGVALIRIYEVISKDSEDTFVNLISLILSSNEECSWELRDSASQLKAFQECFVSGALTEMGQISLIYGIVKCLPICNHLVSDSRIADAWSYILEAALRIASNPQVFHSFHAFRTIAQWLSVTKIPSFYHLWKAAFNKPIMKAVIWPTVEVLDQNWESPVNGLNECCRQIYASLFDMMKLEPSNIREEFLSTECRNVSHLPWTSRAKYRKLAVLFRYASYDRILAADMQLLPKYMFLYLSVANLSYPISDAYKSFIDSIITYNKAQEIEDEDGLKKAEAAWENIILPHMKQVIVTPSLSATVHMNLVAHILPYTIKRMPKLLPTILKCLQSPEARLSQIAIIRIALSRKDAKVTQQILDCINQSHPSVLAWLRLMLADKNHTVRKESFSILLHEDIISDRQIMYHYLKLYVASNLSVDDPSFRQNLVSKISSLFSTIFIRLSNSLKKLETQSAGKLCPISDEMLLLVWCIEYLSLNIMPGVNFQRRQTCLQILKQIICDIIQHKTYIESAFSSKLYNTLMLSVQDRYDAVRLLSSDILILIHQARIDFSDEISFKDDLFQVGEIFEYGFRLIHSPKHQESHSGALLISLVCYILETSESASFEMGGRKVARAIQLLDFLIDVAKCHLDSAKTDSILHCAKFQPIHGVLLTLTTTLGRADITKSMVTSEQFSSSFYRKCLHVCEDVRRFALDIFTCESQSAQHVSPSFKEMMNSLYAIMRNDTPIKSDSHNLEKEKSPSSTGSGLTLEALSMRGDTESDLAIPINIQYLASFCWLNIKESAILMTSVICNGLNLASKEQTPHIDHEDILKVGISLVDTLGRCRHIGAIEAVSSCLQNLTRMIVTKAEFLISKGMEDIRSIPMRLLKESVQQKLRSASQTNITRRSAGLSLITLAILNGEASSEVVSQTLYEWVTFHLIEAASQPYDEKTQGDETKDLPQAYARHVLKCIVMSSTLSKYTCSLADRLIPLCVQGFTSPRWALRNASLQLYGACCTRILGQRKIRTDDPSNSQLVGNTLTANELFLRFPELAQTFYEVIKAAPDIDLHKSVDDTPSRLVPILSTLALLSPKIEAGAFEDHRLTEISSVLFRFIKSPYYKIRSLAAQSLTAFLPFSSLGDHICIEFKSLLNSSKIYDWNQLHGLILIYRCIKLAAEGLSIQDFKELKDASTLLGDIIEKFRLDYRMMLCRFEYETARDGASCDDWPLNINNDPQKKEAKLSEEQSASEFALDSKTLSKLMSQSEEDKSPEQRLACAKYLHDIDPNVFSASSCQYTATLLMQLIIRFLQDEDADVRNEGSQIVAQLLSYHSPVPSRRHEISMTFSYSVSLDLFIHLISQRTALETLFEFVYLYLNVRFEGIKDAIHLSQSSAEEVLFEQEELNVFGEASMVALKLGQAMYQRIFMEPSSKIKKLLKEECAELQKQIVLKDHQLIVSNSHLMNQKSLQKLGTWRMPRAFGAYMGLWIRSQILVQTSRFIGGVNDLFDSDPRQIECFNQGLSLLGQIIPYHPGLTDALFSPGLQLYYGHEYLYCNQSPILRSITN